MNTEAESGVMWPHMKTGNNHQKLKTAKTRHPSTAARREKARLHFRLWPPELVENEFVILSHSLVVIYYCSLKKLVQMLCISYSTFQFSECFGTRGLI